MKYRILTLFGLMALSAATLVQAQDYDDIYYDASSSKSTAAKTSKVAKPSKTVAVYGEVPETYKVAANSNYRVERDVDEYNRRGVEYESDYELDLNGDTIYEDAFANTRRIERFYNPDIVILSDDDDLVELYYDESPSINLIIGSDAFAGSYYGWNWASSYYPWYTWDSYYPWGYGWYDPWYPFGWYRPINYGGYFWGCGHHHWYYSHWWPGFYGWDSWHYRPSYYADWGHRPRPERHHGISSGSNRGHVGLADNRNGRGRIGAAGSSRNSISARGDNSGNRPNRVGSSTSRSRASSSMSGRGNMDRRSSGGVTSRNSSVSRSSSVSGGVSRSSSSGSYSRGSRFSSSGSYSSGSRSSGSYNSGSRSSSSGSYNSGSRSSSSGSYSSGSSHSSGGGSHGGSAGGGGRRR